MSNENLDLLSNWTTYSARNCSRCLALCCSLPVEVDLEDLFTMKIISEDEKNLPIKKIAKNLEKRKIVKQARVKTGLFTLYQKSDHTCIFLNADQQCAVYENRPKVCRDFPNRVSPRIGFCPYSEKSKKKLP